MSVSVKYIGTYVFEYSYHAPWSMFPVRGSHRMYRSGTVRILSILSNARDILDVKSQGLSKRQCKQNISITRQ